MITHKFPNVQWNTLWKGSAVGRILRDIVHMILSNNAYDFLFANGSVVDGSDIWQMHCKYDATLIHCYTFIMIAELYHNWKATFML